MHNEVIGSVFRRLLKTKADNAASFSQFGGTITEEDMREVSHSYLPLKRNAPTPGCVRAHAGRL